MAFERWFFLLIVGFCVRGSQGNHSRSVVPASDGSPQRLGCRGTSAGRHQPPLVGRPCSPSPLCWHGRHWCAQCPSCELWARSAGRHPNSRPHYLEGHRWHNVRMLGGPALARAQIQAMATLPLPSRGSPTRSPLITGIKRNSSYLTRAGLCAHKRAMATSPYHCGTRY